MVLARTEDERKLALDRLLPMQRKDFEEIFTIMDGLPVIIRLLDPPLHEFLPKDALEIKELAKRLNIKETKKRTHGCTVREKIKNRELVTRE